MIDLRYKDLPQAIEVNGRSFLIDTDFRAWIKVGELFKQDATLDQYLFLFTKDIPTDPVFIQAVQQFFYNPNVTPKFSDDSGYPVLDYVLDGEYIYGAFMQAYHIDLVDIDYLHWHKFKALVLCLPNNTMLKEIMGLRSWKKDNTDYETQCRRNKEVWSLPHENSAHDEELLNDINELFYNC